MHTYYTKYSHTCHMCKWVYTCTHKRACHTYVHMYMPCALGPHTIQMCMHAHTWGVRQGTEQWSSQSSQSHHSLPLLGPIALTPPWTHSLSAGSWPHPASTGTLFTLILLPQHPNTLISSFLIFIWPWPWLAHPPWLHTSTSSRSDFVLTVILPQTLAKPH